MTGSTDAPATRAPDGAGRGSAVPSGTSGDAAETLSWSEVLSLAPALGRLVLLTGQRLLVVTADSATSTTRSVVALVGDPWAPFTLVAITQGKLVELAREALGITEIEATLRRLTGEEFGAAARTATPRGALPAREVTAAATYDAATAAVDRPEIDPPEATGATEPGPVPPPAPPAAPAPDPEAPAGGGPDSAPGSSGSAPGAGLPSFGDVPRALLGASSAANPWPAVEEIAQVATSPGRAADGAPDGAPDDAPDDAAGDTASDTGTAGSDAQDRSDEQDGAGETGEQDEAADTPLGPPQAPAAGPAPDTEPDRPELRERARRLLAQSATLDDDEQHPAFGVLLEELAPDEMRILRVFARHGDQPVVDVESRGPLGGRGRLVAERLSMLAEVAGCKHPDRLPVYLDNLERLRLVRVVEQPLDAGDYEVIEAQDVATRARDHGSKGAASARFLRRRLTLSAFGAALCRSCLPV